MRLRVTRRIVAGLLTLAVVLLAIVWLRQDAPAPRMARAGYVHDPPYMFRGDDGTPQGLDVDVLRQAARRAGVTLDWVYIDALDSADHAMRTGHVDIWPALTILPSRQRDLFFTDPWLQTEVWVVVRDGTALPPATFDGAIGFAPLPVTNHLVRTHFPRAAHALYRDGQSLAQALCDGKVHVGLLAAADLSQAVSAPDGRCRDANLRPFVIPESMLRIAVAARPGFERTASLLRAQIDAMAADGSIRTLILPYSLYAATEVLAVYELLQARAQARLYFWGTTTLGVALAGSIVLFGALHRANRRTRQSLVEKAALEERLHAAQRLELVGQFAGGIAHDFNNLVTVIMGYAAVVAERTASDPVVADAVEEIRGASDRATDLVRQLLAFGRKDVIEPRVLELHRELETLRPMMRRLLRAEDRLSISPDAELDRVLMDQGQLSRVLLNLIINARDAMPDGGTVCISTSSTRDGVDGRARVRLRVEDTGVGMAADVRARVFEPFFTTKAAGHGSGLGLSAVHGIVRQAGGEIEVESTPGVGTRFDVWLPVADADATASTTAEPAAS